MKLHFFAIAALGLVAVACSKKQNTTVADSDKTEQTAIAQDTKTLTAQAEQVSTVTSSSETLNPEHGQPGHRCDIPVGAPLSSPPQQNQPMPSGSSAAIGFNTNPNGQAVPAPAIVPQPGTKPAINPPHGEPFHNCDIKVGDPLL